MKRAINYLLVGATAVAILGGCQKVSEPWDNSGYFEQYRERSATIQKQLRDRVAPTQNEYERPSHQTK